MRMNLKSITIAASLGLSVALGGLTGCMHTQGRSAGQYWDDRMAAAHVKKALHDEPVYKYQGVNVTSFERVVQLSGFVQTDDQRKRAGQIASTVPGVREIVNNILVRPEGELAPTGHTNAPVRMGQPINPAPVAPANPPLPDEEKQ